LRARWSSRAWFNAADEAEAPSDRKLLDELVNTPLRIRAVKGKVFHRFGPMTAEDRDARKSTCNRLLARPRAALNMASKRPIGSYFGCWNDSDPPRHFKKCAG
jgi:hypothetical protein